jgi:glycosyltransferase involved in cell wall biosynthesis
MDLRGTAIDLNLELLRKKRSGRKLGVWAHLSRAVKPPNALDLAVERWQMRRCDHIFAYTQQGADVAIGLGLPPHKVTAVMNSVDVSDLIHYYQKTSEQELSAFIATHGLIAGKTFAFIGGLDFWKRTTFLSKALDYLWTADPTIKLLIAGAGDEECLLDASADRGQVVKLGYCGPAEKAMVCRVSEAILCPGRIGLVAVDALAVGIPILTTKWGFHAPEYDYLAPGNDVVASADDPLAFCNLVLSVTNSTGVLPEHVGKRFPTIEDMVHNFAAGVRQMFTNGPGH